MKLKQLQSANGNKYWSQCQEITFKLERLDIIKVTTFLIKSGQMYNSISNKIKLCPQFMCFLCNSQKKIILQFLKI